jgi:hypothetical protein
MGNVPCVNTFKCQKPSVSDSELLQGASYPGEYKNADDAQRVSELEKERARETEEERAREAERLRVEAERERKERLAELARLHNLTRKELLIPERYGDPQSDAQPPNRYGDQFKLPDFDTERHVPVLGLINPKSGAQAGTDILNICKRSPSYQHRFFNIVNLVKPKQIARGNQLDIFRIELNAARDEARAMNTRTRLISGGGDGTASFSLFVILLALQADDKRADEGLADTGNGFIWTDQEMRDCFPALVQLPLGTANDFGNILGWGRSYPGGQTNIGCGSTPAQQLDFWFGKALDRHATVTNFDLWGIMPHKDSDSCNFKVCELVGPKGWNPKQPLEEGQKQQLVMKQAEMPVPFFVSLYFSVGLFGYVVSRFQLNRHKSPLANKAEYARQVYGIVTETRPAQLRRNIDAVKIECEGTHYFPPRPRTGNTGNRYREVGFYNINWQAGLFHGANRGSLRHRVVSKRTPVTFNDGMLDMYRFRFSSLLKNPGLRMQTDKKKDMLLHFNTSEQGTGVFFQYDGEARFAFSPTAQDFCIYVRQVLTIPVVMGPYHNRKLTGDAEKKKDVFEFCGETEADIDKVKQRIVSLLSGSLAKELNATNEELISANLTTDAIISANNNAGNTNSSAKPKSDTET